MPKVEVTTSGDFHHLENYLRKDPRADIKRIFNKYGPKGVAALANATPIDSGLTEESWYYEIVEHPGYISLRWHNRHMVEGVPVVILLEYGHGTRDGGYVQGHDFIMPAIRPIFEQIEAEIGEEVTK